LSQPSASAYNVVVEGPSTTILTTLGSAPSAVSTLTLGSASVFTFATGETTTAQRSAFPVVVVSGSSTFTSLIAAAQTTSPVNVVMPITLSSDLVFAGPSSTTTSLGALTSQASFFITNVPASPTTVSFSTDIPAIQVVSSAGLLTTSIQQVPTIVSVVYSPSVASENAPAPATSPTPGSATSAVPVSITTTGEVATYTGAANSLKVASGAFLAGLVFVLAI